MGILDLINEPNDIKKIPEEDYRELAKEIRRFLIKKVSNTGGHLASNLGTVELTMALHLFLDFPVDNFVILLINLNMVLLSLNNNIYKMM